MWALACVIFIVFAVLSDWLSSKKPWNDYFLLRTALIYSRLWHRWSCNRPAPFPAEGPAIVISNHTCSADPPIIIAGCNRLLSFLVAHQHFHVHPIANFVLTHMACLPVKRDGQDPGGLLRAMKRLADGRIVCVFPEGNLSGVALGRLRHGKPGAALLALRTKAPVYPIYVSGGPRTDNLLRAWLMPSPKAVRVIFGPAIDLSAYYDKPRTRKLIAETTNLFMKSIEELKAKR